MTQTNCPCVRMGQRAWILLDTLKRPVLEAVLRVDLRSLAAKMLAPPFTMELVSASRVAIRGSERANSSLSSEPGSCARARMGVLLLVGLLHAQVFGQTGKIGISSAVAITKQPEDQAAQLNGSATFSVSATGSGIVYIWSFNGATLPGQNGPALTIPRVTLENVGLYAVQLLNSAGALVAQSESAELTIPGADLVIRSQPQSQKVALGAKAVFFVDASSSGGLTYQWLHNGKVVPGATQAQLVVPAVMEKESGSYRVRVSTATAAILSEAADLIYSIGSSPTFVQLPVNQTVPRGASTEFSVSAAGNSLSYVWHRNGARIPGAAGATLNLSNVQPSDAGEYFVSVIGPDGTSAHASAVLKVLWLEVAPVADISSKLGNSISPLSITLSGDAQSLAEATLTSISSNSALIDESDILFSGVDSQRWMVLLPKPGSYGMARITIRAEASQQLAQTQFYFAIPGPNTPPSIFNLPSTQSITLGQDLSIPFRVADSETLSSQLQVEAHSSATLDSVVVLIPGDENNRLLVIGTARTASTSQQIEVVVRDSEGATARQSLTLKVIAPALQIARDGSELVLSSPALSRTAEVEYCYLLGPSEQWRPLGYTPKVSGELSVVRFPLPANKIYFRLRY